MIRLEVTDESNNFTMVQIFDLKSKYVMHINDKGQDILVLPNLHIL